MNNAMLPPNDSVQICRDNYYRQTEDRIRQIKIKQQDTSGTTVRPVHRVPFKEIPRMGTSLSSRGQSLRSEYVYHTYLQRRKLTQGQESRQRDLQKIHETPQKISAYEIFHKTCTFLPLRRVRKRV